MSKKRTAKKKSGAAASKHKKFPQTVKTAEELIIDETVQEKESADINTAETTENNNESTEKVEPSADNCVPQSGEKSPRKKPSAVYICFVAASIILAGFVIWLSLTKNEVNVSDLWKDGLEINILYLVFGAVIFLYVALILEGMRIQVLLYPIRKKFEPLFCVKVAMLGRCYDLLTPLMLGGKPYQIGYYYSRGMSVGDSTSVALSDFLAMKLGFSIVSVLVLIFLGGHLSTFETDTGFMAMVIVGVAVVLLFASITLFMSLNKRVTLWVATGLITFFAKIKLIKNKEASLEKTSKTLEQYRSAFRNLIRRPFAVIGVFLLTACVYVSYAAVVFFVHAAFFGIDFSLFPIILLAVVLFENIMGVVPLPGGTGGVEIAFFTMFTVIFSTVSQVGVAFLIWKMITFILPIFNGLTVVFYDALWGNKKNAKRLHSKAACDNIKA